MESKKIAGGTGITAGGDVAFGDISGQVVIGENISQVQAFPKTCEKLEGYLTEHTKDLTETIIKPWFWNGSEFVSDEKLSKKVCYNFKRN